MSLCWNCSEEIKLSDRFCPRCINKAADILARLDDDKLAEEVAREFSHGDDLIYRGAVLAIKKFRKRVKGKP